MAAGSSGNPGPAEAGGGFGGGASLPVPLTPLPATAAPPGEAAAGGLCEAGEAAAPGWADPPLCRADEARSKSLATERLAAATPVATPFSTFIARFISPIVSAIALAEILPARSRSSTASLKRVKMPVTGA